MKRAIEEGFPIKRTEREIAGAIERARQASEALRSLTQDLDAFNMEHYRTLRGHFTMEHLRLFVERAVLRLGGAFVPSGALVHIETPEVLLGHPGVVRSYREVTFDRELAMRRRNAQLLGLGHPLVDALIRYFQRPQQAGDVTALGRLSATGDRVSARAIVHFELDNGRRHSRYVNLLVGTDGSWADAPPTFDGELLASRFQERPEEPAVPSASTLRRETEAALVAVGARLRSEVEGLVTIRHTLAALASH